LSLSSIGQQRLEGRARLASLGPAAHRVDIADDVDPPAHHHLCEHTLGALLDAPCRSAQGISSDQQRGEKKDAPQKADQCIFVCPALICPTPHSHTLYLYTLLTLPRAPHPLSGSGAFNVQVLTLGRSDVHPRPLSGSGAFTWARPKPYTLNLKPFVRVGRLHVGKA